MSIDLEQLANYIRNNTQIKPVFMLELHLTDGANDFVVRYNDTDVKVWSGSDLYECRSFEINNITSSSNGGIDSVRIRVDTVDKSGFGTYFMQADQRDRLAKIKFGLLGLTQNDIIDVSYWDNWTVDLFIGFIGGYRITDEVVDLDLVGMNNVFNRRGLRTYTSNCQWRFKSTQCGYTGTDYTYCCKAFKAKPDASYTLGTGVCDCYLAFKQAGDTEAQAIKRAMSHFGGFRYMASLEGAKIWWGSKEAMQEE